MAYLWFIHGSSCILWNRDGHGWFLKSSNGTSRILDSHEFSGKPLDEAFGDAFEVLGISWRC